MDLVCRTCLKENDASFNIYKYTQHERLISDLIMELTSVKIRDDDGFPVNICHKCLEKLNSVYDFKKMIIKSDIELLQSRQNKIMKEENKVAYLKEEPEVMKIEEVELSSYNDQNMVLEDCENTPINEEFETLNDSDYQISILPDSESIKEEDMLEELYVSNDCDYDVVQVSNERPYTCSTCQKTFKCTISLQNHEVCHKSVKQFKCEECSNSYTNKRSLLNHQVTHSKVKKMVCPTCGKLFPHKTSLNHHVKRHLEIKPYGCDVCSKRFTHKRLLNQHLLIHKGIKPYSCKICEKKFRQKGGLGRHMRTHTGETPYSCKLCATSFRYTYRLKNHMKTHDVEDTQDDEVKNSDSK